MITVLDSAQSFYEQGSGFATKLEKGDTLVSNIRYQKTGQGLWRRSVFYYTRRAAKVNGQYFAYCIIDAATGKLLAYYARDRIGSRLVSLISNRTPNGSSTAKPIFHALNFDMGNFKPFDMWTDSGAVTSDVPWKRSVIYNNGKPWEVSFANSAVKGSDYRVHNHNNVFDGCMYIFDHLAASNNIMGTEMVYRLNTPLSGGSSQSFAAQQFLYRLGALGRITGRMNLTYVTGVRLYKELCRIAGAEADTITSFGKRVPVSDSMYSAALGTLELTLYEQAHVFNCLYNNNLAEKPSLHPSLVIEEITLNRKPLPVTGLDTVRGVHPFTDIANLRPVHLGMHKRLVSNPGDGLAAYDIEYSPDSSLFNDRRFDEEAFPPDGPLSNYAKSGTTDDVLRPYNVDVTSKKRTNYGLWNATIRIDMSKLAGEGETEVRDITMACIGECNTSRTGERDGKTLHKFLSGQLLKTAGIPAQNGFYRKYEQYIKAVTPDSVKNCAACLKKDEDDGTSGLKKLLDRLPFGKKKKERHGF
jgi:hypothetical protein